MSFIDNAEKNVKRYLLKEQTGGSVAGHTGGRGMGIDQLFAGPFHPNYDNLEDELKQQLKDREEKRKETDSYGETVGEPDPVGGYYAIDTTFSELAFEELDFLNQMKKEFNIENTPILDTEWKSTGWDYDYDEPGEAYKIRDIEYDDNTDLYAGDTYINKSETNWKRIK